MGILLCVKVLLVLLDELFDRCELLDDFLLTQNQALGHDLGNLVHQGVLWLLSQVLQIEVGGSFALLQRLEELFVIVIVQPFLKFEQLRNLYHRLFLFTNYHSLCLLLLLPRVPLWINFGTPIQVWLIALYISELKLIWRATFILWEIYITVLITIFIMIV